MSNYLGFPRFNPRVILLQIYFAGINCWQPRSDCRRTLSKIQQFPKLVAYVTHETGVEYRGPRDAQYMSEFLRGVIRPIHRLTSPADLARLRNTYNVSSSYLKKAHRNQSIF